MGVMCAAQLDLAHPPAGKVLFSFFLGWAGPMLALSIRKLLQSETFSLSLITFQRRAKMR